MRGTKTALWIKLGMAMAAILIGTVLCGWIINSTMLEKYYYYNKQSEMTTTFELIDNMSAATNIDSDRVGKALKRLKNKYNIDIIVASGADLSIITSTLWEPQIDQVNSDLQNGNISIIEQQNNYYIAIQKNREMNTNYLILMGTLSDSNIVYMRSTIESIHESAQITNLFLRIVGIGSIVIGIIIIIIFSKSISRPIRRLTLISDRMARLDFEAKYDGKGGSREIDELGVHFNDMSNTLEKTISELKSANNELKRDIQEKEHIDEMRKEFLSNVSHELKTPIALIQGYAEGLKEVVNDDEESKDFYCEVIMDEAAKMNRMVKKLLTLNQLEFGNEKVELVRFNLNEVIKGVINSSKLLAEQKNVTIDFQEEEPVYIWSDEFFTEDLISNYISNALNHVCGENQIKIWTQNYGDTVRLSVFNTGERIPEEELDKIWVKFYKVDKARTREYGGNGIGLSIVKAIADLLNQQCGVINHESGVEFWVEFDAKSIQT